MAITFDFSDRLNAIAISQNLPRLLRILPTLRVLLDNLSVGARAFLKWSDQKMKKVICEYLLDFKLNNSGKPLFLLQ
jgi:hypothetical protein